MANPVWFDEDHYLNSKLNQLQTDDPAGNWTLSALQQALDANGYSAYEHFLQFGAAERTSPNAFFDAAEYLQAKLQQLWSTDPTASWNVDSVAQAMQDAGLTLWGHFQQYGWLEGVNPSNAFDLGQYFSAKLAQMQADDPSGAWTLGKLQEAFAAAGLDPVAHYVEYGQQEGVLWGGTSGGGTGGGTDAFDGDIDAILAQLTAILDSMGAAIDIQDLQQQVLSSGLLDPANMNPDGSGLLDPMPLVELVWDYFYGTNPLEIIGDLPDMSGMGVMSI